MLFSNLYKMKFTGLFQATIVLRSEAHSMN